MEKLIITDEAESVWKDIQNDPQLTFLQKKGLSGIIQNPGVEISFEDIESYGDTLETLRSQCTKKQKEYFNKMVDKILDYLVSCVVKVEEEKVVERF